MRWTSLILYRQAALTGLAGFILLASPETISSSFGLGLTADAHLLCCFCGATEIALCGVSLGAARATDAAARRSAFAYFAVVHVAEAAAAGLAVGQGASRLVLANAGAHVVIALLFVVGLSVWRLERAEAALSRRVQ